MFFSCSHGITGVEICTCTKRTREDHSGVIVRGITYNYSGLHLELSEKIRSNQNPRLAFLGGMHTVKLNYCNHNGACLMEITRELLATYNSLRIFRPKYNRV